MATTINELKDWFLRGKDKGASHMIIVCDTWDWIDFPVYIMSNQDAKKEYKIESEREHQKVMEVYNLNKDISSQLNKPKAMEF